MEHKELVNIAEVVEMLRCAEINCDNAAKLGLPIVRVVKSQIQAAIKLLGEAPFSEDVEASLGANADRTETTLTAGQGPVMHSSDEKC